MNIINLIIDFSWNCTDPNAAGYIKPIFDILRTVLNILRIVVPIILIVMTSLDITKKIINPEDKDGQKKILTRAIAALIVFLLPTFIDLTLRFLDANVVKNSTLSSCWR